jgi:hypothetical protein
VTLAVVLVVPVAGGGCSSSGDGSTGDFGTKINQIRPGAPKAVVQRELGKPDERKVGVAGAQPAGPQPPVTVRAGSRYEQWIYRRGDTEYHVFMGPSTKGPGVWEVHAVSANPVKASALQR